MLPVLGLNPWTVQPIASHYTDYAIPVHVYRTKSHNPILSEYTVCPAQQVLIWYLQQEVKQLRANMVCHGMKFIQSFIKICQVVQTCQGFTHASFVRKVKWSGSKGTGVVYTVQWSEQFLPMANLSIHHRSMKIFIYLVLISYLIPRHQESELQDAEVGFT